MRTKLRTQFDRLKKTETSGSRKPMPTMLERLAATRFDPPPPTCKPKPSHRQEIWLMPVVVAGSHAGPEARKIISDPAYDLFQSHFSPDGRWIVFEAVRYSPVESTLFVMPTSGGPWTLISKGKPWDDKPRWSPDGKTIYFFCARGGFFNVWGIRFDSTKGKPVGEAFRVTAFENPGLMIPDLIPPIESLHLL